MRRRTRQSLLSLIASGLLPVCGRRRIRHTAADLQKADYRFSTQRFGVRFSEKIRDVFRLRWIRKKAD